MLPRLRISVLVFAMSLQACSDDTFYFRQYDSDTGSVSVDAKQRLVYSVVRGAPKDRNEGRRVVCAEPAPDAVSAQAAQTAAALAAKVPAGGAGAVTPEGQAAFQSSLAESVAYIGVRNSTIQLLRDGLYRACEAYMNGALGDFGYALVLTNYGRIMTALLTSEGITRPAFNGPVTVHASLAPASATAGSGEAGTAAVAGGAPDVGGNVPTSITFNASTVDSQYVAALKEALALVDTTLVEKAGDLATACIMWSEESPMRTPRNSSPLLSEMCSDVIRGLPRAMEQIVYEQIQQMRTEHLRQINAEQ